MSLVVQPLAFVERSRLCRRLLSDQSQSHIQQRPPAVWSTKTDASHNCCAKSAYCRYVCNQYSSISYMASAKIARRQEETPESRKRQPVACPFDGVRMSVSDSGSGGRRSDACHTQNNRHHLPSRQSTRDGGAAGTSLEALLFTQLRHTPPAPAHDSKHPQLRIRTEDDQQERDSFLCCDAPFRVRVGHPQEGNVEDDEDTSDDDCGYCEERKARQDGSFGCLEV
jgi:hypothetical protein